MSRITRRLFPLALVPVLPLLAHTATADLYFSEYVEGSSNNKALEIANPTDNDQDLSSYQVRMFFNGSDSAGLTINLEGTLPAGEVYVIAQSSAAPAILAQADQTNGAGWFNGDDAVALVRNGETLDVIGQIGVDPGSQWGSGDLSTQNRTLRRQPGITSGDPDGTDFFDPAEQWLGFPQDTFDGLGSLGNGQQPQPEPEPEPEPPAEIGACADPATRIHSIQGEGDSSPLIDTVHTIEAVVVGAFQGADALQGFFVQELDSRQDNNPATSEGLFVFGGSTSIDLGAGELTEGDLVRVQGSVTEYFGMTQLTDLTGLILCDQGLSVTPAELTLPVTELAELERIEGMLAKVSQALTINETYNLGRFGELILGSDRQYTPTHLVEPGEAANELAREQSLDRLILDDGSSRQNPATIPYPAPELTTFNTVRVGDEIRNLQGVVAYGFDEYRIHPVKEPVFVPENSRPQNPELPGEGSLTVASFNVLNYFNGDGQGGGFPTSRGADSAIEFERQRAKIINALVTMDADIVGLVEIENDGFGPQSAIQDLVNGLAEAGLEYAIVRPEVDQIGSDAITVGFIYKPASVTTVNAAAILDTSVDSRFLDTKNRPVLAQTFSERASGERLTLAVSHLKSKGSSCDDVGDPEQNDGQGNCNLTRMAAAEAMADWLASDPTGSGDQDRLILGDLNAYAQEDPISALKAAGYSDLLNEFLGENAYSYVFSGKAGYLDHALASESLLEQVTGTTVWNINADEPRSLDYNVEFKTPLQVISLYSDDAWRSSDHDPVLVELSLGGAIAGDFNGNGRLDSKDLVMLVRHFRHPVNANNQGYDLNSDGHINVRDLKVWLKLAKEALKQAKAEKAQATRARWAQSRR